MNTSIQSISLKKLLFVLLLSVSLLGSVMLVSQNNIDTKNLKTDLSGDQSFTFNATINTSVTVSKVVSGLIQYEGCNVAYNINFGDGQNSGAKMVTVRNGQINFSANHTYTTVGSKNGIINYTVRCGGGPGPDDPNPDLPRN